MKYLILIILLSACSAERKAARLIRHAQKDLRKAAILGYPQKIDTVYVTKTIPADSILIQVPGISKIKDTIVYVDKDRVHIKWLIKHDTLKITATCDTIRLSVPVYVKESITCPEPKTFLEEIKGVMLLLIVLIVLAIAGGVYWKIKKPFG